jgi:hypothetical protein
MRVSTRASRRTCSSPNFENRVSDPTAGETAPSGHPIVAEAIVRSRLLVLSAAHEDEALPDGE